MGRDKDQETYCMNCENCYITWPEGEAFRLPKCHVRERFNYNSEKNCPSFELKETLVLRLKLKEAEDRIKDLESKL